MKRATLNVKNYIILWIFFLITIISMPIIIWNLYKILNINCIIGIDTSLTYISGSLTFLGTLGVTLSSLYSSKKADLDKILDKNKILITEGRSKRLSLFADEENTLALSFYIYSLTFPDEIIIKELSIYNPQKTEKMRYSKRSKQYPSFYIPSI